MTHQEPSAKATAMIDFRPVALEGYGVRLEPLSMDHAAALNKAIADGELWKLPFTTVPAADDITAYIESALLQQKMGNMMPWAVRALQHGDIVGSTRFHDIKVEIGRVEIGFTFYAERWQRTHVNTACKLLLLGHAFDGLGCTVVGFRTDAQNLRSQLAIERVGAQKDGTLRRFQARKDGSPRDTIMYSILAEEWPSIRARLRARLRRFDPAGR